MDTDKTLDRLYMVLNVMGAALAVYITARMLVGPDAVKTVKMASVRSAARFAKRQGAFWTEAGGKLDSTYWKIAG